MMLLASAILLAAGAMVGMAMLIAVVNDVRPLRVLVVLKALTAGVGLVLLIIYVFTAPGSKPIAALTLLVLAAVGGFGLFAMDMTKNHVPKTLALIHPPIATAGLTLLIYFYFTH